jgi:hypothetical protein
MLFWFCPNGWGDAPNLLLLKLELDPKFNLKTGVVSGGPSQKYLPISGLRGFLFSVRLGVPRLFLWCTYLTKLRDNVTLEQVDNPAPATKVCTKCKQELPATPDYFYRRGTRGALVPHCKLCGNAATRKHYMTPRGKDAEFRSKYGIRYDDYQSMYRTQAGKCAICGEVAKHTLEEGAGKGEKLVVDHCHSSGQVRSLLCRSCNQGLGKFRDNPRILMQAAGYLQHHQKYLVNLLDKLT